MSIKLVKEKDDLEVFFHILHLFGTQLACVLKTIDFYRRLSTFNDLEECLKNPIFNGYTLKQTNFVTRAIKRFKIVAHTFRGFSWMAAITYSICPIVDGQILAIPLWTPFGEDVPLIYLQIFESMCFAWLSSVIASVDSFLTGMMCLMVAQLDILNENLTRAADRIDGECYELQEKKIQARLKGCIEHHLAIKSFCSRAEEIFSIGIFLQIFSSVIVFCMTALQFLRLSPKSATFGSIIAYLGCVLLQIGMVCCFGQSIITKSEDIRDACYNSKWYHCSTSTKRIIFIMMEMTKREIILKAGNFFDMSLATFVMIGRNAYSYFAVLVRLIK